jgi:hypothetical protein
MGQNWLYSVEVAQKARKLFVDEDSECKLELWEKMQEE